MKGALLSNQYPIFLSRMNFRYLQEICLDTNKFKKYKIKVQNKHNLNQTNQLNNLLKLKIHNKYQRLK